MNRLVRTAYWALCGLLVVAGAGNVARADGVVDLPQFDVPISSWLGGTGVSSPAQGVLIGEGTSAVHSIAVSNGQCLVGVANSDPTAEACPAGGAAPNFVHGVLNLASPISAPPGITPILTTTVAANHVYDVSVSATISGSQNAPSVSFYLHVGEAGGAACPAGDSAHCQSVACPTMDSSLKEVSCAVNWMGNTNSNATIELDALGSYNNAYPSVEAATTSGDYASANATSLNWVQIA